MQSNFKQLFQYDIWATQTLLEKFEHQFPQNERIYVLLSHILSAQKVWLDRCLNLPQTMAVWAERLPEQIKADTENYNNYWIEFIDSLKKDAFEQSVTYTNTRGETFSTLLRDIIIHVLNHSTHHRGEIMILMKEEGFVLPNIDYITYVG